MATRPGDGTKEGALVSSREAEDKLVPLRYVAFSQPTSIAGCRHMMLTVEAKALRLVDGEEFICPQPFLNLITRMVVIDGREYPMERVHYYERAKMALSKDPAPMKLDQYTIGKRA